MSKEPMFTPSSYDPDSTTDLSEFSEEEIAKAREEVEKEHAKKNRRLRAFEIAWAVISTIFAIISTSILLVKNWVDGTVSYVILAILIVYILVFVVLCGLLYRKPYSNLNIKVYGKTIKIFKALANIAFLVLTAMTMVAMVKENHTLDFAQWVVFIGNMIVAGVKLIIKVVSFVRYLAHRHVAKNYSVQVTRYVDGKQQKKTFADKREEHKYKE